VCVYHFVVNKKTSRSGISSSDEFLVVLQTIDIFAKYTASLVVTKNDDILVADGSNNRILSIIRSTGCVQELALSVDDGIQGPMGLCLDESRGRLYVGEWRRQFRVLVFDGVKI